jgi:GDPmannose 4,6-dehydratase
MLLFIVGILSQCVFYYALLCTIKYRILYYRLFFNGDQVKKALITGITGQDGSYLAELLLEKGYEVHGLVRRNSNFEIIPNIQHIRNQITLHYGDLTDSGNLRNIMLRVRPDEVYNLAAQSHVHVSFDVPEFTAETNAVGVLNMLEAVRALNAEQPVRFYQASTSEMFGKVQETPQKETTPFYPRSPYGVAKVYGYWITINYRESYGLHASNGILFNHESPRRGETFVTRKITKGIAQIVAGKQKESIKLGNLDAVRDWGHARDFVEGMWLMLQQDQPGDYVLATGEGYTVRDFINMAMVANNISFAWFGNGVNEKAIDLVTGKVFIEVDEKLYRPAEVSVLCGDSSKAQQQLGWSRKYDIEGLIRDMVAHDRAEAGL